MTELRPLLACLCALILAATSAHMAVARAQAPAAGIVELCIGEQSVTFAVDAEGRPLGPRHLCPDCVPAVTAAALPAAQGPVRPATFPQRHVLVPAPGPARPAATSAPPPARAPPPPV
ncbi:MAG: hypothetical protein N2Z62_04625 [Rhodobacteraceae bacterium]|nr:hypothetical protein [Paracoccaceae bacterium]